MSRPALPKSLHQNLLVTHPLQVAREIFKGLQRPGIVLLSYFLTPSANKPGELCRTTILIIEVDSYLTNHNSRF